MLTALQGLHTDVVKLCEIGFRGRALDCRERRSRHERALGRGPISDQWERNVLLDRLNGDGAQRRSLFSLIHMGFLKRYKNWSV